MSAPKFESLIEMFERSTTLYADRPFLGVPTADGWQWVTYAEIGKQVAAFRTGLSSLGLKLGDKLCLISSNRVESAVAVYSCLSLGITVIPMYEAQHAKEWAFIAEDSGACAVISGCPAVHEKCLALKTEGALKDVKHFITIGAPKDDPSSFQAILEGGRASETGSVKAALDDIAFLIYTSGTTGNPKGVMLSHGNILSNINSIHELLPVTDAERTLSFLPWAHCFGLVVELLSMCSIGASMALNDDVQKLIQQLPEVRPTIICSVPKIFIRIYDGINKQMLQKPAPIRALFEAGMKVSAKKRENQPISLVEKATHALADKLIFSKVRAKFGGRLRYAISASAALSPKIAEFIDNIGITVFEAYGLTETSPASTGNSPIGRRLGSVGRAMPGIRISIDTSMADDGKQGEIIVNGPNVMKGYYNRPEETKAVMTSDGGLRTGDLGYIDDDGYLFITGRIKEQYKLENGKYVAPAPIEEQLKLSPYILNVMVYGDNKKHNVALIVPNTESLLDWAKERGLSTSNISELLNTPNVKQMFQEEVDKLSKSFKGFERIRSFAFADEDFTAQNNMLTPTLKIKRRVVMQKYGPKLDALYS